MIAPEPTGGKGFRRGIMGRGDRPGGAVASGMTAPRLRRGAAFLSRRVTLLLARSYCGPISAKHTPS
jgi:hypothetical protein